MKYEDVNCVGACGNLYIITGNPKNKKQDQKCIVVNYSPEISSVEIAGKYENMAIPMTYNPFEIFSKAKIETSTSAIKQLLKNSQKEEIMNFFK